LDNNFCEIRIYDPDFNWLDVATQAESVLFTRELYGVGSFEIRIHPDKVGAFKLARRDNIIVINGDGHKSGIIRDFGITENRDASFFTIFGETGNGFTKQRTTVPPTASQDSGAFGWDRIRGNAETVLKHYISRHIVSPADAGRRIPNIIIAPNQNRGVTFPWQTRFQPLNEELTNIANFAEMGFEFFADIPGRRWVFDVVEGLNRAKSQSKLSPVVFRMEHSNIEGYNYKEDFANYRSTGYALGAGEDERRQIYTLGTNHKGRDRWEIALDCGSPDNINELMYYGEQRLNEYQPAKTVEANALPKVFVFERDYFLGDKVTVYISRLALEIDTRITSVKDIWERTTGRRSEIRFGDKLPNLFSIFNRREEVR